MPFRASNAIASERYTDAKRVALQLQSFASNRSTTWAGGADASQVISAVDNLKSFRDRLNDIKSTPGIAQYAKDQETDQGYDITAEFNAMIATVDTAITSIVTAMPKDGSGYILAYSFNANGSLSPRAFSAGALSGIRGDLEAIVAAVS